MPDFIKVTKISDIPNGQMRMFEVNGKSITIANVGGEFYAFNDICTHAQCNLSDGGTLEGKIIECPCHGSKFDIKTGEAKALPATEPIKTYKVKVEGENILVQA